MKRSHAIKICLIALALHCLAAQGQQPLPKVMLPSFKKDTFNILRVRCNTRRRYPQHKKH